ncbi:MAG: nucleotidyltransferase family protein [Patescibacteria group bacterium]
MKAVILAAGKGTRMGELTKTTPKGLLMKKGKPLLEYTLEVLPPNCEEIIIVIEYLGDQIRKAFGNEWNGIPVRYVEQGVYKGTGGALLQAREHLVGSEFLVLPCDDTYHANDILNLCKGSSVMMISKISDREFSGGNVKMENGRLVAIEEGTHLPPAIVATGAYLLNEKIFNYPLVQIPGRDEYGLPQMVVEYAKHHPVKIMEATQWTQVSTPADLL